MAALTPKMLRPYHSCGLQNAHTWKHLDSLHVFNKDSIDSNIPKWIPMGSNDTSEKSDPCAF